MSDGVVIPFPGSHDVKPDDDALFTDADLDAVTEWVNEIGGDPEPVEDEPVDEVVEDEPVFDEPQEFIPVDGEWVFLPASDNPANEMPKGMVAHRIRTMCKWQHRHMADGLREPQRCCYSVLVTTARLDGPVRMERSWLAET